jgi:hypothetical protein
MRIDPSSWLKDSFARMRKEADLLRLPVPDYIELPPLKKDELRQTQLERGEHVRLLGSSDGFHLIMKFDGTLGWVPSQVLDLPGSVRGFSPLPGGASTPETFFRNWLGTPYVWGGSRREGIDCSGFTQRYYLDVIGKVIPKNSRDQRRSGRPRREAQDHDLIFCHHRDSPASHHVALFFGSSSWGSSVWHARLNHGVVRQSWDEFVAIYEIEQIVCLCEI